MAFDREKFKQLVHYVIWKAGKRDWFGATKLNKVLWFADARAYVLTGRPITGPRTSGKSGNVRAFVSDGARSIGLPTVAVLYECDAQRIINYEAKFRDSEYGQAGHA